MKTNIRIFSQYSTPAITALSGFTGFSCSLAGSVTNRTLTVILTNCDVASSTSFSFIVTNSIDHGYVMPVTNTWSADLCSDSTYHTKLECEKPRKFTILYSIETTSDNDDPIENTGYQFWPKEVFKSSISASNTMYNEAPGIITVSF